MPLPFDPLRRVDASTAKHDLLKIDLGDWILDYGSEAELGIFIAGLNSFDSGIQVQGVPVISPSQLFHQIYSLGGGSQGVPSRIRVISQENRHAPRPYDRPLIGGKISLRERASNPSSPLRYSKRLQLDLDLNPTRFVRHQGYVRNLRSDMDFGSLGAIQLRTGQPRNFAEYSLDGNDNVLCTRRLEASASERLWPIQLERYWRGLWAMLDHIFTESARIAGIVVRPRPRFSLQTVESYWEFSTAEPIQLVRRIEPFVSSLAEEATTSYYYSASYERNSPSLRVKLKKGLNLRIYAKTNRRVRFEIIHKLNRDRTTGRHTGHTWDDFQRIMQTVTEYATGRINRVFDSLADQMPINANQASVCELVNAIVQAVPDPDLSQELLVILVSSGGRLNRLRNSGFDEAIDSLVEVGLIQTVAPRVARYRIVPRFSMAIAQLRGQARVHLRSQ